MIAAEAKAKLVVDRKVLGLPNVDAGTRQEFDAELVRNRGDVDAAYVASKARLEKLVAPWKERFR